MISPEVVSYIAAAAGDVHAVPLTRDPILRGVIVQVDKLGGNLSDNQKNDLVIWAGNVDKSAGGDDAEAFAVMAAAADIIDSYDWYVSSGIAATAAKISGIGSGTTQAASDAAGAALASVNKVLQQVPTVSQATKYILIALGLVVAIELLSLGNKVLA